MWGDRAQDVGFSILGFGSFFGGLVLLLRTKGPSTNF